MAYKEGRAAPSQGLSDCAEAEEDDEEDDASLAALKVQWIREQEELKMHLVLQDDFSWHIPSPSKPKHSELSLLPALESASQIGRQIVITKNADSHNHCYEKAADTSAASPVVLECKHDEDTLGSEQAANTETNHDSYHLSTSQSSDHLLSHQGRVTGFEEAKCAECFLSMCLNSEHSLSRTSPPNAPPMHVSSTSIATNIVTTGGENECHETPENQHNVRERLKHRLIRAGDYTIPKGLETPLCELQYVGGVDLSFDTEDPDAACAALVVLDFSTLEVIYETYESVRMTLPYMAGFLAFRECPVLLRLLEKLRREKPALTPQVLLVDGNGLLHPRGFGLACHLGVSADIPTIGVGKSMHHVDGMTANEVRALASRCSLQPGEALTLIGRSGHIWGAAFRSHGESIKPIFVSIGHRISLSTAIAVVRQCCNFRIPEPIRQADKRSREQLRQGLQGKGL